MLIRKVHIRQGFFDGRFDKFSNLIQIHFPELFGDKRCFFTSSLPVFLCMNRFQHCGNAFHMFPWTHRECIPIPVDDTALPLRIREKISDNSMQPGTFIRHDQLYSGKSAILQITQEICPGFFIFPTPFRNAED